ncbi:MAG: hypothetical protein H6841_03295 [Planctomycetes bacterium]|nr:hypothetical protein [Planctomycetota bacterium]MCB9934144.1 hypothetical protein [Planctomycetota bacterium]
MKRVAVLIAVGVVGLVAGCGSDGIVFNGVKQVDQFPIRKTPIVHYNLPSEVTDPVTGDHSVDVTAFTSINLAPATFTEQATPGHDLWAEEFYATCTDNPTCPPPNTPVPDFIYTTQQYKPPGADWPDPTVTSLGPPPSFFIGAWTLSLQHQWFLRDVDGTALAPAMVGNPPVQYESVSFSSMAISIVEATQQTTPGTQLPVPGQQEAIPAGPTGVGANGIEQIVVPASNFLDFAFNGEGAPAGLLGAAWRESPAQNKHIETSYRVLQGVPAPDYFGGGGPITSGGGLYHKRFSDHWQQTTGGANSTIDMDDGVNYSYYLAAVGNHLIGYGLGLVDSSFALPGVINNQEDIMNLSVILDMTAFIAAGKEFQFVVEDLLRLQDTVNGDWMNPGILSTLPGTYR